MKWLSGLCLLGAISSSALADQWYFDVQDAADAARSADRLLVIVQFDCDFLGTAEGSGELANYQHHALNSQTSQWLADHAVLAAQNVGWPSNLQIRSEADQRSAAQTDRPGDDPRPIGNSMTWICDPDGRVLFFLPGYPDSDLLLAKLTWADRVCRETADQSAGRAAWQVQAGEPEDHEFYQSLLGKPTKQTTAVHRQRWIDQAVGALVTARQQRLGHRFGGNWSPEKLQVFSHSLNRFAAFENQFAHSLLASLPDVKRSALQRPLWQQLARTRIWEADRRTLVGWVEQQRKDQRPLLLRVVGEAATPRPWPPQKPDELVRLLREFAIREASLDEVALAARYLKTEPLVVPPNRTPAWFATTSSGDTCRLLTHRHSNRELTDALWPIFETEEYRRER